MPELAVGWIKLTADASAIPGEIRRALGQADRQADAAGKSMGGKMSGALGKALKAGAASAAAAGVATLGTAMVKGFQRLDAIDQAKAKLSGLGNSASDVSKIMDNALASVKGTAFGMGDAASLAGVMVAAGVKPGKELESTLKRVADSAAIAGTDLNDMGQIWGKVAAKGKVDGEIVNQMLERQIPIYDILGAKMKKTPEQIAEMVSQGKVSFQDFSDAMNDKIGGSALKMGDTVKGATQNMIAALGRLGASAMSPFFGRAPGALTSMTDAIDGLEPKVKELAESLDSKIFNEWGPKLQAAMESAKQSGAIDDVLITLKGMAQAGVDVLPALAGIGKALAEASARIGVGTWQLLLATLQAATGILNIVNPALGMLADFMRAQPGLVTAALAAWVGFKTIPSMMSRVVSAVSPLSSALSTTGSAARTAGTGLMGLVRANGQLVATSRTSFVEMGRFGSMIGQVGTHVPVIGRMQSAFMGAAAGAERFGRTAGTFAAARTAMQGVGNAAGGLVNALGGPLNASLIGITVVGGALVSSFQRQNSIMAEQDAVTKKLAESYYELSAAMEKSRGEATDEVMSIANRRIEQYREGVDAAARADGKWHEVMYDGIGKALGLVKAGEGLAETHDRQAAAAQEAQRVYDDLGMSTEDVGKKVYGSAVDWAYFAKRLGEMGPAGQKVRSDLNGLRVEFLNQQRIAKALTPGISEVTEAIRMLGDDSVSSADKMNALKTAMNALNPTRNEAEAMKQWGDQVRSAADAAAGIDGSAFDMKGKLDSSTEAGGKLLEVLGGLADTAATVASAGGDMTKVAREQDQIFERLAASTGKTKEEIKALYDSIGGNVVDIAVALKGKPEVIQQLGAIKAAMDANPSLKEFQLKAEGSEQVQYALKQLDIEFKKTPDGKLIKVDLTGDAGQKLRDVITAASQIPPGKEINVNTKGGQAVYDLLKAMNVAVDRSNNKIIVTDIPNGSPVLQLLRDIGYEVDTRNGKSIIVKADDTDYQKKKPGWIEDDYKTIWVTGVPKTNSIGMPQDMLGNPVFTPPRADGAIVDAFANGGLKQIKKPRRADIYAGRGAGTIFAEEETGGEAYIPLASSKRGRSTSILAEVADRFGLGLVQKRADGAVVTADDLKRLANGEGASQPLKGAPYDWGGVNWGDCCLTWETPVWGPHGAKPIGLIQPGDQVWSFVDGKIESHEVTAQWFSKRQEVFKVRTRHRAVTGSANHPFLRVVQTEEAKPRVGRRGWDPATYGVEWARLDELRRGDLLVQPKAVGLDVEMSNTLPSGREIGMNEAWLLGVILGDGNISDTKVEICVYGDLRDRVRGVLAQMRLDASVTRAARDGIGTSDSDAHGIRAYSTQFARELDEAGFRKPAHEKHIPACVWGWDQDRQRAFLNGYCDADGHHPDDVSRYGERTYASSSRRLIEDVRYLHITLGDVVANVSTNHRGKPIVINGKQVKNARPLHSIAVRPIGEELVSSVAAMRRPGVADWVASGDFTVAPVLDVTPVGEADTYDIEVASSANFIAGGVVVHNSGAMSAFARKAVGLDPFGGRFSTATEGDQLRQMGFRDGGWSQGVLAFGWVNGGPGGGHTAGTLPDGTNVEMGGGYGGGMVGGTVGANDGQFTNRMFIPVGAAAPNVPAYQRPGDEYNPDPNYQPGQNGATTSQPQGASLSERLGNAASAAVSGQVQSLLGVLGANDSPGVLAAINEYESQRSQNRQSQQQKQATPDPGTTKPKEGEDTGKTGKSPDPADTNGLSGIKAAFKQGLRDAWRSGVEWDATDWIVNKESTWRPDAQNGKYWGLIQAGEEVYRAAGVDPKTIDPTEQAKAFDKYVDGRYQLPTKAKAFHEANNWYDQGGIASAKGLMLKGVNTPERVLSPRQTAAFEQMVKREFQGAGADQVVARLDRLISLMESQDRGGDTFNWTSSGNSKQDMDEVKRARRVAKLAGV